MSVLNPCSTFATFVVDDENPLPHWGALHVAERVGTGKVPQWGNQPLYICGGREFGKTHLLHAIGNRVLELRPDAKVLVVSAENFTNKYIEALKADTMPAFRQGLREADLLLIDDLQFLAGKERSREEFGLRTRELLASGCAVVCTGDRHPRDLGFEKRLHSLFSWGLVVDVKSPGQATRVKILDQRAQVNIPMEVLRLIAEQATSVRQMEGFLVRVEAFAELCNDGKVTFELAVSTLRHVVPRVCVGTDTILADVATHFGLRVSALLGKGQTPKVSRARHVAMWLLSKTTELTLLEIAQALNRSHHSTAFYAIEKIDVVRDGDRDLATWLDGLVDKYVRPPLPTVLEFRGGGGDTQAAPPSEIVRAVEARVAL